MKCRICKREIPDNSLYCNWCGVYQLKRKKQSVTVPNPVQLPSGAWRIQLRKEGISVTDTNRDECIAEAKRRRKQWIEDEAAGLHIPPPPVVTLQSAMEDYIASRKSTRSPNTLRGYKTILDNRFGPFMDTDINSLDTQQMVDYELDKGRAPKTIRNAWGLVASTLNYHKVQFEPPCLPRVPKSERNWLDYNQIISFLSAVRGSPFELPALLALHSLRKSELLGLRPCDYDSSSQVIHVRGALHKVDGAYVRTDLNKNDTSSRDIPVIIPRLTELLKTADMSGEYIVTCTRERLYININSICRKANLPETGVHGLRHSFASLAYHLGWKKQSTMKIGGWRNSTILDEIYTHNADLQADVNTMKDFFVSKT